MDPFQISLIILAVSIILTFAGGLITRNYSHVDRLWSLLPPVYVLVWMTEFGHNPRFVIAAVLVLLWGIRLTANFAVKGGYAFSLKKGFYGEDYRWEVLRNRIPNRFLFELFNLFFISAFQLTLIFFFTLPLYYLGSVDAPLAAGDYILFSAHFMLLGLELTADLQQLRYYKLRSDRKNGDDMRIRLGFNTFGLWKYSRHPNYLCEIGQWVVVYFYLHRLTGIHFTMAGCSVLLLLFAGSTIMAEGITGSKYPLYADWKKMTAPWIPGLAILPLRREKNDFLMSRKRSGE